MADAKRDQNFVPTLLGVSSVDGVTPTTIYVNPTTHRVLVDLSGGGTGTVTDVSVVSANGFAGSVATSTSTPAITLTTTVTGILSGDGTAISAATTTGSGSVVLATSPTLVTPILGTPTSGTLTNCTGLPLATGVTGQLALANGGTGANLTDPNADRILFWDDSAGAVTWLTAGTGLTITGTTMTAGTGDVVGPASATDEALVRFDGTTGKLVQDSSVLLTDTGRLKIGGADGSAMVDIVGATTTVQGLRIQGDVSSAISFSTYVAADAFLRFSFLASGLMTWGDGTGAGDTNLYRSAASVLKTDDLMVATLGFQPASNDGAALGVSGTAFSDLFLASGAVINFNAGNATITHSAGLLTFNTAITVGTSNAITCGTIELGAASDTTIARSSAGVITVEGVVVDTVSAANTLSNKTLTAPKFANGGFIADANGNEEIIFNTTASAVNEIAITNAATGTTGPLIQASGETNVDLRLSGKGTGKVHEISGVYGDLTADTDGATITFNLATSNIHTVTLGGNRTLALSNASTGQCFMLRLQQDATGSRTVTWFTTIKWAGGSAPTLTTTANKADMIGFVCTGSGTYDGFVVGSNI